MSETQQYEETWKRPDLEFKPPEGVQAIPARAIPVLRPVMRVFSRFNVWVYRMSGGRLLGSFAGSRVCLVTMTGRKTGQQRTIPLIYIPDGEDVILVASQGGLDFHPVWYKNLAASPEIEIEEGSKKRKMLARRATDDEKRDRWPHILSVYKDFDEYQTRTERNIPVMICSPR